MSRMADMRHIFVQNRVQVRAALDIGDIWERHNSLTWNRNPPFARAMRECDTEWESICFIFKAYQNPYGKPTFVSYLQKFPGDRILPFFMNN